MPSTIERLKQARVRCTVQITPERRALAEERALKRIGAHMKIDGFREGRAPMNVIRDKTKPEMILEETVRMLAPDLITETMKEHDLKPIISPKLVVTSKEPLAVELLYVERPAVKLAKPNAIKLEKKDAKTPDDKEVEEFVKKVLAQDRQELPVDRAAAKGDLVRVHLSAVNMDGSPMQELNNLPYSLTLGSEDLIPELDSVLVGAKVGETKAVSPRFPKDHAIPALRDKTVKLEAKVTAVAEVKLPELTAEFIKTRMGMDQSPEDFRKGIRDALTEQAKFRHAKDREEEFFALVRKSTTVDLAPEIVENEVQNMLADLQENLSRDKLTLEDWLQQTGKEPKQVLDEMRGIATDRITLRFGLQELIRAKEITIDAAEMTKSLEAAKAMAQNSGRTVGEADMQPGGDLHAQVEWELQVRQVMKEALGE